MPPQIKRTPFTRGIDWNPRVGEEKFGKIFEKPAKLLWTKRGNAWEDWRSHDGRRALAKARNVRAATSFVNVVHRGFAMRATRFSNNGSRKSASSFDADLAKRLATPPANGENGRRRKSRPKPNGENAAVARPESSTGVENQPRCGRSSTPFAPLRACHPAASPNGGNGGWTAFVVMVAPTPNGGNGWTGFVTPVSLDTEGAGRVVYVAACGQACREGEDPSRTDRAGAAEARTPTQRLSEGDQEPSLTHQAQDERDGRGRFVKGNKGGPGNPFNRRLAAMRKALCKAVTAEDIRDLRAIMLAKARDGDLAAMKLVLLYAIGRPSEAVDPDTLDHEEWSLFKSSALPEDLIEITKRLPPAFLCTLFRGASPALARDWVGKLSDMLGAGAPKQVG